MADMRGLKEPHSLGSEELAEREQSKKSWSRSFHTGQMQPHLLAVVALKEQEVGV